MGSKYLCLECGEIYDSDWLNNNELFEYIQWPKTNCVGTLIEVDELLLPTIKILNEKGYSTKFCCSGHYESQHPNGYIAFEDWVDLPYIPDGFKADEDYDHIVIRSTLPYTTPTLEDFKTICDNAKTLLDWAISLPDYESDWD